MTPRQVLLTRPQADSEAMLPALRKAGLEALIWPLTRIETTGGAIRVPAGTDALVFTSHNGVGAFAAGCDERLIPVLTVGDKTASAARQAGFADVASAGGNLDDLVRLIDTRRPGRLFYPRGQQVSADLGALVAPVEVVEHVIYAAVPGGPPPDDVAAALAEGRIAAVCVWSRRAAAELAGHIDRNRGWQLAGAALVAISARAAQPLADGSFAQVVVASHPRTDAMIADLIAALRQ